MFIVCVRNFRTDDLRPFIGLGGPSQWASASGQRPWPGASKNVITRSLGPNSDVQVDIEGPFEIQEGDKFLLCSDGLSGQVDDVEIATLLECLPEDLAVEVLVDLANLRGGPDNTTVLVATVTEGPLVGARTTPAQETNDDDTLVFWGTIGAIVACGLCAVASVAFWMLSEPGPMVIAVLGAMISGVIAAMSYSGFREQSRRRAQTPRDGGANPRAYGGKGPYRRYIAKPDQPLYERLGKTVDELRDAAKLKNWLMDWGQIDDLQRQGASAMQANDGKSAISFQAKAIIETMHQLREQHSRSANETAIDQ